MMLFDKKKSGRVKNCVTSWKPWKSFIIEPSVSPRLINVAAVNAMNTNANGVTHDTFRVKPISSEITTTSMLCIIAVVAPPNTLPITTEVRELGVTSISFRNPNCLSHSTAVPDAIEVRREATDPYDSRHYEIKIASASAKVYYAPQPQTKS